LLDDYNVIRAVYCFVTGAGGRISFAVTGLGMCCGCAGVDLVYFTAERGI